MVISKGYKISCIFSTNICVLQHISKLTSGFNPVLFRQPSGQAQQNCHVCMSISTLSNIIILLQKGCCLAPYCKHFFFFLLICTNPFWQEQEITTAKQPAAITCCQASTFANMYVTFIFRLQNMIYLLLCIFPLTLVGRKCLSSATSIRKGLMNDEPVPSCIYIKVAESNWLVSPYCLVVLTVPLSSLFNYFELNKLPENMTPDIPKAVFIQYRLK